MLNILHVDDEPDIREVVAFSLAMDPHIVVRFAASGREALIALQEGVTVDVVLLDVMMPGLDGPSTLEQLRRISGHADTPVIFITARAQSHEVDRFLRLGAIAVIIKPFDPMLLSRQVRDHLASR